MSATSPSPRSTALPIRSGDRPAGLGRQELAEAYIEPGTMVNSGQFNGMPSDEGHARPSPITWKKQGWGKRTVSYKLRDWLISRQRYWGAPIPMVYCDKCGIVPVPEKDLPVLLPEDAEFKPTGESPLKYCESFVNTTCPKCGGTGQARDRHHGHLHVLLLVLPALLPARSTIEAAFDPEKVKYWMPVDIYTGGAEHAVMHLLYARFFIKAIRDMGLVDFGEPFTRLFNQGTIIAEHQKMSKSPGNVVNPDDYVSELGADTVRAYLMFVGPWEQGGEWDDSGISGISRWLNRVWNLVLEGQENLLPGEGADPGRGQGLDASPTRPSRRSPRTWRGSASTPCWRRSWSSPTTWARSRRTGQPMPAPGRKPSTLCC